MLNKSVFKQRRIYYFTTHVMEPQES